MAEFCISNVKSLFDLIRMLGHVFSYPRKRDLNQRIQKLDHVSVRRPQSVEEYVRQRNEFSAHEDLYKAVEGRESYRPPPFIGSASFKDCKAFQSRESTFNQIMEALRNEDLSMIGVWGMAGVGKTTLVKQIAQQAEKGKLFHKVIMALNISQTPNIPEIQGKIARMLGLTFEEDEERAVRLRQSLKKQEKILVILDDICEKLELEKIGIPYGDDHKGCKVLLTSRERQVLSKDMRTQKEFHIQQLSDEEAWNLFKKTAGDSVEKPELRFIAVDVAKKCEGLPVAIVPIANALRGESVPVWENALEELRLSAPTNIRGVSKNVYSCLELSYNHLEGDEVKSLFLLCGLLGGGDISLDRLLQYAMGLNLFERLYSWEQATNKLFALVEILTASRLLLDHEEGDNDRHSSLLFYHAFVRMHDVVCDVARSIASKDPHRFVVREAVGLQEEWQWMDECRNCTRISLKCRNMDELAQGLVCPKLEFFLLNSSNDDDSYLKIPDAFFQDTKQLRVLDLSKLSLAPSPSSLGFLSNLQTLCLNQCQLLDVAVIGELRKLQVLSLAESNIKQLPKEVMQLSDLRMLDLRNCHSLKVIPRNVISSLSGLKYLSMKGSSRIEWEAEGFNSGERTNACLSELKHLSSLRALEVEVSDPSLLPEDDVLFDNHNLTRYSIVIGDDWMPDDDYKAIRRLKLDRVKSLHMVKYFSKLLKRSQVVHLRRLNDTNHVVYELDKDGFLELKYLTIYECPTIQYILHCTSVEWAPPRNTFCMLEQLDLAGLSNLEAVWHGPIPMWSFGNLRILRVIDCERLKYVFSLPTQHGRESAFPQLQSLSLEGLREVISFYSTRSSGSQELVTFFNQQAKFLVLEFLRVCYLDNVRALWHNQLPTESFVKLKYLYVSSCNKLLNVFPVSVAKALVQLEELEIESCGVLEAIVANEDEDEDEATPLFLFPKLISLTLKSLHQLKRFCSGKFTSAWPLLKNLKVSNCDKVKILFQEIGLEGELDNKIQQPLFLVEKEAFPNLEELRLSLNDIVKIWRGKFSKASFSKVRVLNITEYHGISFVISSNKVQILRNLERLEVTRCDSVKEIIKVKEHLDEEFETIQRLTEIHLEDLPMLMDLSGLGPYFQSFQILEIVGCGSLINLVTPSMAKRLVQLKTLIIRKCHMVKEIVGNEGDEPIDDEINFTRLKRLELDGLPNLKSFCPARYVFQFPSLEEMEVIECPRMEFFCKGILCTPRLKCVQMGYPFFEYCWANDLNTTLHELFMGQNA